MHVMMMTTGQVQQKREVDQGPPLRELVLQKLFLMARKRHNV